MNDSSWLGRHCSTNAKNGGHKCLATYFTINLNEWQSTGYGSLGAFNIDLTHKQKQKKKNDGHD